MNKGAIILLLLISANNAAIVESFATKEVYAGIGAALNRKQLESKDLVLLLSVFQQLSNFGTLSEMKLII